MKRIDEGTVISYSINTSRFAADGLDLIKAEALDKKTEAVLMHLEGTGLAERYTPAYSAENRDTSGTPVIRFELVVPSDQIPSDILSRLSFVSKTKAALPFTVTGGDVHLISAES